MRLLRCSMRGPIEASVRLVDQMTSARAAKPLPHADKRARPPRARRGPDAGSGRGARPREIRRVLAALFSPRIGRRRAFSWPWSASMALLAYCAALNNSGRQAADHRGLAGRSARSVTTSVGSIWVLALAREKKSRVAPVPRRSGKYTSTTWPNWSIAGRGSARHRQPSRRSRPRSSGPQPRGGWDERPSAKIGVKRRTHR